ncbi:MAG: alpha/beta fold hydrolase [Cognatishimia sp.]
MEFEKIMAVIAALSGEPIDPVAEFGAIATGGHDPSAPVTIRPCPQPIAPYEIEGKTIICGTVSVPENHDAPDGNRIELLFSLMKAETTAPEDDPVVYLHGGPGAGNMNGLKGLARVFGEFRRTRDVVTFDQRAAGLSNQSVTCAEFQAREIADVVAERNESALLEGCIAELNDAGIALENYNTLQNALDVPMVVRMLGYDDYNIYGISYGTKLTLEILRTAPEGVNAVVIDGVAPPWIKLYDTLAEPLNDAMVWVIEDCASDLKCNEAYPNLGQVLGDTLDSAIAGILLDEEGEPVSAETILAMFELRNGKQTSQSITPYLPAMIYEFSRPDQPTPTLDRIYGAGLVSTPDVEMDTRGAAIVRTPESQTLFDLAISEALRADALAEDITTTLPALRRALNRERTTSGLAQLLDREMSVVGSSILSDGGRAEAAAQDFAALPLTPTREALSGYVRKHFDTAGEERLLALIAAMSDAEIGEFFDAAAKSVQTTTFKFAHGPDLAIYTCQEELPYNSLEGYRSLTAALEFPQLSALWDETAEGFFKDCGLFTPSPREGFHDVVQSDIPTLAIGSTWDIQTSFAWVDDATEGLTNSQTQIIPEVGHGALIYVPCVRDMTAAFFTDPTRQFDTSCADSQRKPYYIAPWVQAALQEKADRTEIAAAMPKPSFDCAAAVSSAEKAICENPALAELDLRIADWFAQAEERAQSLDAGAEDATNLLRAYQRGWIKGRDECWKESDLETCIRDAYLLREGQLVAEWQLIEPVRTAEFMCAGNPANVVTVSYFETERPAVRLEYGDGIETGVQSTDRADKYDGSFGKGFIDFGEAAELVWTQGEPLACELIK